MKTLVRLTDVVEMLEVLVGWMERNPGAAASSELRGRVQELKRRVGKLCDEAQPSVRRRTLSGTWAHDAQKGRRLKRG